MNLYSKHYAGNKESLALRDDPPPPPHPKSSLD